MNNNDFDMLIKSASEKLGASPNELKKSLEKKDLSTLRRVLADKELMKQLKTAGSPEEVMRLLGSIK